MLRVEHARVEVAGDNDDGVTQVPVQRVVHRTEIAKVMIEEEAEQVTGAQHEGRHQRGDPDRFVPGVPIGNEVVGKAAESAAHSWNVQ